MDLELYNRFHEAFADNIQGGCSEDMYGMLDRWIDDGDFTEDEVRDNEEAIASLFDHNWFTCEGCGWTMPMSEMADNPNRWVCGDCDDE